MKIGDLLASVLYTHANTAENYSIFCGDISEDVRADMVVIDKIIAYFAEVYDDGDEFGADPEKYNRDFITTLERDYSLDELIEAVERFDNDSPAWRYWLEEYRGPTPEEIAREEARAEARRLEYQAAPRKYAIIGRGVHEVIYLSGEWHRVHPKHGKTRVGVIKENNLFEDQKEAQRELRKRQG